MLSCLFVHLPGIPIQMHMVYEEHDKVRLHNCSKFYWNVVFGRRRYHSGADNNPAENEADWIHFLIEMDTNENSRLVPEFTARFRKLKFTAKAFVAAHYKSMKFVMIFNICSNILPYSAFLFFHSTYFFNQ